MATLEAFRQPEEIAEIETPEPRPEAAPRWGLAKRILFRFTFSYLTLYFFPWLLGAIPYAMVPGKPLNDAWNALVAWVGKRAFGADLVFEPTGSGDTTADYVNLLCVLGIALMATAVWSILDRKRPNYIRLHEWLRVYVRVSLAFAMIVYGGVKAINSQFREPGLDRLLQPFGEASPMRLLWTFMGASQAYTMFSGIAELAGGILLVFRRTTLLGALVAIGVMSNVVMLNFSYDVPVKLFSSHLLLAAVFLTLPDLSRIANFFVLNRPVEPSPIRPLFRKPWLHRAVTIARTVFFLGFAVYMLYSSWEVRREMAVAKSPLYGIWEVEEFAADGEVRPPLMTDSGRWRRVVFDRPEMVTFYFMPGSRWVCDLEVDEQKKLLNLTAYDEKGAETKFALAYDRPQPGRLRIEGTFEGQKVRARLHRRDESKLLLTSRGFHWINEYPFNR